MVCRLAISTSIAVFAAALAAPALAQTDPMAMARNSAANELGVLEYCQANGHIDGSSISAQKTVVARLPAGGGSTDAAEALGRHGTLLGGNGTNVPISDMASRGNTTEADLCTRMAGSVKQSAVSPAMPMPGGMPAMPSGMPAMPSGMPSVPSGIPGMPHR